MRHVCKIFVAAIVMSIMLALGAGPAFASNEATFSVGFCTAPPGGFGLGTQVNTFGVGFPCAPTFDPLLRARGGSINE